MRSSPEFEPARFGKAMSCLESAAILTMATSFAVVASANSPGLLPLPIVGKWRSAQDFKACSETYEFRSDGNLLVVSGERVAEGTYEIAAVDRQSGYFLLVFKQTASNGREACSENPLARHSASPTRMFIKFDPYVPAHLACEELNFDRCFGPFLRTAD